MTVLEVEGLVAGYDRIEALHGVSLTVGEGEAVTLIGSNGAGKTTLLKSIAGLITPWSGSVRWHGKDVTRRAAEKRSRDGLVLVPEGRKVFAGLTVEENLTLGGYHRKPADRNKTRSEVYDLFPRLRERRTQAAGTMSGGEQQMLAIGRALMAQPSVVLLDEPSLGLAPKAVTEVTTVLCELVRRGSTLVLVEQNAHAAFKVAHRGYLLDRGTVAVSGPVDELRADPRVRTAYLGETV
ncbi:ABC transporter ATP-binding protein [Longispora albida]|uniref:ABC transporter ATP-binding protein n=1 Tax=Longispora albida TaxID=203523 RepID=UPI00037F9B11|nr:ABC transporter ATP-binding protein [Longispora albida]